MIGEIRRCSRCILPETFPNITFGQNGICSVCVDYDRKWSRWKKVGYKKSRLELHNILENLRSLNRKYDCIVPASGGKDSTYILYLCKTLFKLNVLAVNFNNRFQTDQATKNIAHAVNILDTDLFVFRPRWNLMKRLYSCFLLKAGECCTPCNVGIRLIVDRIALHERIPLIIWGDSPRTDERSPDEIYTGSIPYFLKVLKKNGLLDFVRGTIYQDAQKQLSVKFRIRKKLSRLSPTKIKSVYGVPIEIDLPRYTEWNEKEIFDVIKREVKWEESKVGKEHTDCKINPVKCFLRQQRWGFGSKTQKYAALVRDGQMRRDTALDLIKEENKEPEQLLYVLDKLDLSRSHLAEIKNSYHLKYV